MKSKDKKALHQMTVADLTKKLAELELSFAKAQMEKRVGKLADLRTGSKFARVKTVIKVKEMEA